MVITLMMTTIRLTPLLVSGDIKEGPGSHGLPILGSTSLLVLDSGSIDTYFASTT